MQTFSFPFRYVAEHVAVIDDRSDQFAAQVIAAAIKTQKGELPNTPSFGSDAWEFQRLDTAGLMFSISAFHPKITIQSISETVQEDQSITLKIEFDQT